MAAAVHVFGIRHHGPGSARSVSRALRELRPDCVLVEGPPEADDLLPLLENIHGETRHCGKTPRRLPQNQQAHSELVQLRNRLKQAVTKEDYEEAARIRDKIRQLEESGTV